MAIAMAFFVGVWMKVMALESESNQRHCYI